MMQTEEVPGRMVGKYWWATCPECRMCNRLDPEREYRPQILDLLRANGPGRVKVPAVCEHFLRLKEPGQPSPFLFGRKNSSLFDFEEVCP